MVPIWVLVNVFINKLDDKLPFISLQNLIKPHNDCPKILMHTFWHPHCQV